MSIPQVHRLAAYLTGSPRTQRQRRALLLLAERERAGRARVPERDMSHDEFATRGGRSVGGALVRRGLADWSGSGAPVTYWLTDLGREVADVLTSRAKLG